MRRARELGPSRHFHWTEPLKLSIDYFGSISQLRAQSDRTLIEHGARRLQRRLGLRPNVQGHSRPHSRPYCVQQYFYYIFDLRGGIIQLKTFFVGKKNLFVKQQCCLCDFECESIMLYNMANCIHTALFQPVTTPPALHN